MKPKIYFELDYTNSFLWGADEYTKNTFGYNIDDFLLLGLSKETIKLSEYLAKLYYESLNPLYPPLISFWSGEMFVWFQKN